jgi:threonine dehydrogenase-like Zn-dependent dehydrogenase
MKAVVWHALGDVRLDDVPEPTISPYDAIVRITTSAIRGTDLHFVRDTMPGVITARLRERPSPSRPGPSGTAGTCPS